MTKQTITDAVLIAYLDESLTAEESAQIENCLRSDDVLRGRLSCLLENENRGVHTLAAIWRRERISCPSREHLGSYLLGVLDEPQFDYIQFHLETIKCPYCQSSLADMQSEAETDAPGRQQRRSRYFESSVGRRKR